MSKPASKRFDTELEKNPKLKQQFEKFCEEDTAVMCPHTKKPCHPKSTFCHYLGVTFRQPNNISCSDFPR